MAGGSVRWSRDVVLQRQIIEHTEESTSLGIRKVVDVNIKISHDNQVPVGRRQVIDDCGELIEEGNEISGWWPIYVHN